MKVHVQFDLSEIQRRQIRASLKRGGAATRKEIRVFMNHVVIDALEKLPPAKMKRVKAVVAPIVNPDAETLCGNCAQPFVAHAGMMQSCPGSLSRRPGLTRFKAVA